MHTKKSLIPQHWIERPCPVANGRSWTAGNITVILSVEIEDGRPVMHTSIVGYDRNGRMRLPTAVELEHVRSVLHGSRRVEAMPSVGIARAVHLWEPLAA
jgi:hypothetical protein